MILQVVLLVVLLVHLVFSVVLFRNQKRLLENDRRIFRGWRG